MTNRYFLTNPGLELGNAHWTLQAGGTILVDANARSGSWVLRHVGDSNSRVHTAHPSNSLPVRPGCKVSASAYLKGGTAGLGCAAVQFYTAGLSFISAPLGNQIAFGSVPYVQSILTDTVAPSRAKFANIVLFFSNTPTGTWYVDDIDASGDIIETIPTSAKIASHRMFLARTQAAFEPLVGSTKFSDFNTGMSDKWSGVLNFIPLRPQDDLGELVSWVERLGRVNKFFCYDPDRTTPKNGVVNGMVVDGASQVGNLLRVRSGPVSTTALVAGDYIEVADQYYQLVRDLRIGPQGTGMAHIMPSIRTSPADGEDVITNAPKMVARITSEVPRSSNHDKWTSLSVSWEEV
jgi:hypothetical protein